MYYVYMLWCRDDTLYTGTASDLCRRMRQHRDGGAACARYTRSHPPRELAGVWRTEGRGEALRLEYAVKRLSRQGKLTLLHRPETAADLLPGVAAEPVPGVTLAMCLEGEFHE
ncbi:MAG: GIY-YIG nuclease family protein [Oscillospiraceae bacterium]